MTAELIWLTMTAILAASLWIPYIVGVNRHAVEGADPFVRPHDLTAYPPWVHRAHRAHLNMIEQALPFAIVVLIAHHANISTPLTVGAATAFFWLRVAHAVGMISGRARFPARPLIFTAGWITILVIAVEVLFA